MLIHLLVIVITAIAAPRWLAVHVLANALFPATLQAIAAGEDADSAVDEGLWQPPQTAELSTSTAIARTAPPAACRQPPPNPDSTPADVVPARTYMKCLGTTTTTRACHLQNVYYSIDSGHFLYYGPEGVTPEVFGQAHPRSDPWLRLIRCAPSAMHESHALACGRLKAHLKTDTYRPACFQAASHVRSAVIRAWTRASIEGTCPSWGCRIEA